MRGLLISLSLRVLSLLLLLSFIMLLLVFKLFGNFLMNFLILRCLGVDCTAPPSSPSTSSFSMLRLYRLSRGNLEKSFPSTLTVMSGTNTSRSSSIKKNSAFCCCCRCCLRTMDFHCRRYSLHSPAVAITYDYRQTLCSDQRIC